MATASSGVFIIPVNRLEAELGSRLTGNRREEVTAVLRVFMQELRAILERSDEFLRECKPDLHRCGSCAFNPATDVLGGFAPTAYGFLRAIQRDQPFFCHGNQAKEYWERNVLDLTKTRICHGYLSLIAGCPEEVKQCVERASRAIQAIVTD